MRAAWLLLVLTACGRIGFDPGGDAGAGDDDDTPGVFVAAPLPAGGEAWSVRTTPVTPDVVYAIIGGRIVKSTDRGATFTDCGRETFAYTVFPDPTVADLVYAGDAQHLAMSTDACATWTDVAAIDEVGAIAKVGGDLFVGSHGLYRVHGTTVTPVDTPLHTAWVDTLIASGLDVLATSEEFGVVRSGDDGLSFVESNTGLTSVVASGLSYADPVDTHVVFVNTDAGTFRSANHGTTWTAVAGGADGRDQLAVDPNDPQFVVSATWFGINRSADGGTSFDGTNARGDGMEASYASGFAFDPSTPDRVYAATGRGLFVADDRALDWHPAGTQPNAWLVYDLTGDRGTGKIYAATAAGVLRSDDNGRTWTLANTGMQARVSNVMTVAMYPGPTLLASSGPFFWYSDDGHSFTENTAGDVGSNDGWQVRRIRVRGSEMWMGTASRLWRTTDGETFDQIAIDAVDRYVYDIAFAANGDVYVATDLGVWRTSDSGVTFDHLDQVGAGNDVYALLALSNGTIAAGAADGVYIYQPDTGRWRSAGLAQYGVTAMLEAGGSWLAATTAGVFASADGGATWSAVPGLETKRPVALYASDDGQLVVGTSGYGIFTTPLP